MAISPAGGNQYTANWTDEAFDSQNAEGKLTDVFSQIYKAIRLTNNFITLVPASTGFPQSQVNYWLGEAKFIRAYDYFQLVKYYGGVPLVLTAQTTATPVAKVRRLKFGTKLKLTWNQLNP